MSDENINEIGTGHPLTDVQAAPEAVNKSTAASAAEVAAVVEAILFASDSSISVAKIGSIAELPQRSVKQAISQLNERYETAGCVFRIEEIASGHQMMTLPEYHDVLKRLLNVKRDSRLSQAAMETLAIVAYRQPILRADVEAIRGVACGEVLRGLLEKQLVKIVGRAEVIGRPMLYGTTRRFLEVFGLADLEDLPRVEELRSGLEEKQQPAAQPADETGRDEEEFDDDEDREEDELDDEDDEDQDEEEE